MKAGEFWVMPGHRGTRGDFPAPLSKHRTQRNADREARRVERTQGGRCEIVSVVPVLRVTRGGRP